MSMAALVAACANTSCESAHIALQRANTAMGRTALNSISFAGNGTGATFGQAYLAGQAKPKIIYSTFSRVAEYENAAFREDASRSRAEPNGGGAVPLMGTGEQRTSSFMRGASAWYMVGPAPVAAPVAKDTRVHDLWTTPHGVIKVAQANNATAAMRTIDKKMLTAVSFSVPGRYRATALSNAAGMFEQIESTQPHPVMGDIARVIRFSYYKDTCGVKFPTRIQQSICGYPVLDMTVSDVTPNAPAGIEVPALVTTFTKTIVSNKVADGVWYKAVGSHNSVVIEMKDHIVVVESPLYDGRAVPMLAKAKKLSHGKPIRFVVNSHHHFDYAGGLCSAVAEGAALLTTVLARSFFETAMANPNSIKPDAMQTSCKKAIVISANGKRSFTDGARMKDVYYMEGSVHADGFFYGASAQRKTAD